MTKEEAIKILLRYDVNFYPHSASDEEQAIFMAIEALRCSETPNNSERAAETAQPDHVADVSKKDERTDETAQNVSDSDLISRKAAIEAMGKAKWAKERLMELPSAQPEQRWIPCSERLPEEDHWLGGSGRQFSDEVLVSVVNYDDEDTWVYISQTIDGEWALELPRHCEIIAWMPLPASYKGE